MVLDNLATISSALSHCRAWRLLQQVAISNQTWRDQPLIGDAVGPTADWGMRWARSINCGSGVIGCS